MSILPRLSIATKLYAIFTLLAIATLALALVAVVNARRHAMLTEDFQAASQGAQNVERLNGLIYAVWLESRGVVMSADEVAARYFAANLIRYNDRISDVVTEWQWVVRPEDAAHFEALTDRIKQYQEFTRNLASNADDIGLLMNHNWGKDESDNSLRTALNQDLETFGQLYSHRAKRIYA